MRGAHHAVDAATADLSGDARVRGGGTPPDHPSEVMAARRLDDRMAVLPGDEPGTERHDEGTRVVTRRSAAGALEWGGTTVLSNSGDAGGSVVAIGGDDRAACAWAEAGRIQLATID